MARRKYTINALTGDGIDEAIRGVREYQRWIERKTGELCQRCAEYGAKVAKVMFSTARYDGGNDVSVTVERRGETTLAVVANGTVTWVIEFGSGVALGRGHPEAKSVTPQMGPGTYPIPPGKGHWNDPHGWYLPKEKGGGHTYGNPPAGAMYGGHKEIEQEFSRMVREVFDAD